MNATLVAIGLGGMLGALARYGIDAIVVRRIGAVPDAFPWGTLLTNVTGSFVLGVLFVALVEPASGPPWVRAALTTGFLGAFTTFSTFSVQIVQLSETGRSGLAFGYLLVSIVAGVFAAAMAVLLTRVAPTLGWVAAGTVSAATTAMLLRLA